MFADFIDTAAKDRAEWAKLREQMAKDREESAKLREQMAKDREDSARFHAEIERDRREMNKRWGELANKMGTLVEDMVAPNIPRVAREHFGAAQLQDFMVR